MSRQTQGYASCGRLGRGWARLVDLHAVAVEFDLVEPYVSREWVSGRTTGAASEMSVAHPHRGCLLLWAFDLLHLNGDDLRALSLADRKHRLGD
jgi:ATP-dependent DNA ligase